MKNLENSPFIQAYTSVRGSAPEIKNIRDMAILMNSVSFHSKLVDNQEGLLSEVADLTFFWLEFRQVFRFYFHIKIIMARTFKIMLFFFNRTILLIWNE